MKTVPPAPLAAALPHRRFLAWVGAAAGSAGSGLVAAACGTSAGQDTGSGASADGRKALPPAKVTLWH